VQKIPARHANNNNGDDNLRQLCAVHRTPFQTETVRLTIYAKSPTIATRQSQPKFKMADAGFA
jgi:hypothetical protein